MRLKVSCMMSLWIHSKSTNITLITFNSKMNNIQMINKMRFVLKAKKENWKIKKLRKKIFILRHSTSIANQRSHFWFPWQMFHFLVIYTLWFRIELAKTETAEETLNWLHLDLFVLFIYFQIRCPIEDFNWWFWCQRSIQFDWSYWTTGIVFKKSNFIKFNWITQIIFWHRFLFDRKRLSLIWIWLNLIWIWPNISEHCNFRKEFFIFDAQLLYGFSE